MVAVRIPGAGRPATHGRLTGFWPATREGLVFLWREPVLRSVAILTALVVGFWLPIEGVLLPVYFEARQQPGHLGAVLMSISAGAVIGALAYAAVGTRLPRRRALNASLLGAALAVLGMAFLPPLPALLAFGFAAGVTYGPINPIGNVALQERTPDRLRGRVLGLSTSIAYVGRSRRIPARRAPDRADRRPRHVSPSRGRSGRRRGGIVCRRRIQGTRPRAAGVTARLDP